MLVVSDVITVAQAVRTLVKLKLVCPSYCGQAEFRVRPTFGWLVFPALGLFLAISIAAT